MKYLFNSMINDIIINKIILIKLKDIKEIISRIFLYDYRAFEIFLKVGKSYYFILYLKESLLCFFEEIEKLKNEENNFALIKDSIKFFQQNRLKKIGKKIKFQYINIFYLLINFLVVLLMK